MTFSPAASRHVGGLAVCHTLPILEEEGHSFGRETEDDFGKSKCDFSPPAAPFSKVGRLLYRKRLRPLARTHSSVRGARFDNNAFSGVSQGWRSVFVIPYPLDCIYILTDISHFINPQNIDLVDKAKMFSHPVHFSAAVIERSAAGQHLRAGAKQTRHGRAPGGEAAVRPRPQKICQHARSISRSGIGLDRSVQIMYNSN